MYVFTVEIKKFIEGYKGKKVKRNEDYFVKKKKKSLFKFCFQRELFNLFMCFLY